MPFRKSFNDFNGRYILLVEDDFLIVEAMVEAFEGAGAEVIGPAATVAEALRLIDEAVKIDGAVLDLNLRGELSFAVADRLAMDRVPFVFVTGYDNSSLPERFVEVKRYEKPVLPRQLLASLLHGHGPAGLRRPS